MTNRSSASCTRSSLVGKRISVRGHLGNAKSADARLASMEQRRSGDSRALGWAGSSAAAPPTQERRRACGAARARDRKRTSPRGLILLGVGTRGSRLCSPGLAAPSVGERRGGAARSGRAGSRRRGVDGATPPPTATAAVHGSGVAMVPGDRFVIEFSHAKSGNRVTVTPATGKEVVVRGPSGAATYSSGRTGSTSRFATGTPSSTFRFPGARRTWRFVPTVRGFS